MDRISRLPMLCLALCMVASAAHAAKPVAKPVAAAAAAKPRPTASPPRDPRCIPPVTTPASAKDEPPASKPRRATGYGDAYGQAAHLQREIDRMARLLDCGDRGVTDAFGARGTWDTVDAAADDDDTRDPNDGTPDTPR